MHDLIQFMKRSDPSGESLAQVVDAARAEDVHRAQTWTLVSTEPSFRSPHLDTRLPKPDFEGYARFDDREAAMLAAEGLASRGILAQTFEVECFETPPEQLDAGDGALEPGFVKRVAVVSRRPDLSRDGFVEYYERQHAPLAARVMPCIARYRRTFVGAPVDDVPAGWARLAFDGVTELYYRSEADRQRFREILSDPEVVRLISEDEVNLFDRSAIHGLDVGEVDLM